jgi:hypothetical protein
MVPPAASAFLRRRATVRLELHVTGGEMGGGQLLIEHSNSTLQWHILVSPAYVPVAAIQSRCRVSKIRELKDASVLDAPKPRPREMSPAALARQKEDVRLRDLMNKLNDPGQVYEIVLDSTEKPLTVRQRLLKVAAESGKEIVVRKYGNGFAVGLMTPERRSRRGRKPKSAA